MSNEAGGRGNGFNRRRFLTGAAVLTGAAALYAAAKRFWTPRPGSALTALSVEVPTRIYGNDAYPVFYRRPLPLDSPPARYPGFKPGTLTLKKGTVRRKGAMPLPCDIVFERDVPMKLRDGVILYTDVFRPVGDERHPAIIAWSPYGKEIGGQWLDDVPFRAGVPLHDVSELQKFEGPDPALYVERGYVVLNPDVRGAYSSHGNIHFWGRQNAEDGHDFVEWAAASSWCSGKVALAGNSWLAVSQWFIAAGKPPHLAAIAPWEGASAKYLPGGIPIVTFDEVIVPSFAGKQLVEDMPKMSVTHPLMDAYWEDKAAHLESIDVPAYVVASYTNEAHTQGTFDGFRRISSAQKWLRVHDTQEWRDFNDPVHRQDLLKFFDHVLKGIDNGWQTTPRVRLAVLNPGGSTQLDRPETDWPLQRQQFRKLYLMGDKTLAWTPEPHESAVSYPATHGGAVRFAMVFDQDTEITGYMSLRVWLEAQGADDMDIAVVVEKLDSRGRSIGVQQAMPPGSPITASTMLRVSHRALDPVRSTPSEPCQSHRAEQLLEAGMIVPVDVVLWPMAMLYRAGEQISVSVKGVVLGTFPLEFGTARVPVPSDGGTFDPAARPALMTLGGPLYTKPPYVTEQMIQNPPTRNRGNHVVHVGGKYDSYLMIPIIAPA